MHCGLIPDRARRKAGYLGIIEVNRDMGRSYGSDGIIIPPPHLQGWILLKIS